VLQELLLKVLLALPGLIELQLDVAQMDFVQLHFVFEFDELVAGLAQLCFERLHLGFVLHLSIFDLACLRVLAFLPTNSQKSAP